MGIWHQVFTISEAGKSVVFGWVYGLAGLPTHPTAAKRQPCTEAWQQIRFLGNNVHTSCYISFWQDKWIHTQHKLWTRKASSEVCQEEAMLTCLLIGHICLIQGIFCCKMSWHLCAQCGVPLTILQIMWQCTHYDKECQTFNLHGMLSIILGDDYCT